METKKLMLDESKTPYENILAHAGMTVERGDGVLDVQPKTSFTSTLEPSGSTWDIEPELGGIEVLMTLTSPRGQVHMLKMTRSYHTKWTVELKSVSEGSDWYAYEHEDCRVHIVPGDTMLAEAWVRVKGGSDTTFLKGSFAVPELTNMDYMGGPGIFLMDPDACKWSLFLDVMLIQPKADPKTPQLHVVCVGLHSRLGGDGPLSK